MYDVVVVGAGVAGATAAHAIATTSPGTKVCVLECGVVGRGDETSTITLPGNEVVRPRISGSAVFNTEQSSDSPVPSPGAIKMMVGLYAATSSEFLEEHSKQDAATWFKMTSRGLQLQKHKAKQLGVQVIELGSIMVAPPEQEHLLQQEFKLLTEAGCNVRTMTTAELHAAIGAEAGFDAGLFFPDDAIIDSTAYAQALLREAQRVGDVTLREHTMVVAVHEPNSVPEPRLVPETRSEPRSGPGQTQVVLKSGEIVAARRVVMAAGAFWLEGALSGLLNPCYSYLVALPATVPAGDASGRLGYPFSPNVFTFGFTHDWSVTEGVVRMSGEDHHSALKPPRSHERCRRLAAWTLRRFPAVTDAARPFLARYGVYSETPDMLPLFGAMPFKLPPPGRASGAGPGSGEGEEGRESAVIYLCGCNAWGQAVMSALGDLVPAALGLRPLDSVTFEPETAALCSVRRFAVAAAGPGGFQVDADAEASASHGGGSGLVSSSRPGHCAQEVMPPLTPAQLSWYTSRL